MSNNTWLESLCQHSGHALTGYRFRATDRTAARDSRENGDGADGSFKRPLARAFNIFLHNEVACERTFKMHVCMASKMSCFLHIFLNVHHIYKSEWISLKISPNVTPSLGMMLCENGSDAT